ncbi:hypothetical protein GOP47_0025027 [Adiantum capillus-veneris]|uniref:Uncharacterized protein n=1 Tax=Adiantum capillus-veneris TaxID=13818 RepID=A0A9D4Z4U8_ADICA|nr:hypothetical protein GOP47_0025027 [Adiantum capillus-veneris]
MIHLSLCLCETSTPRGTPRWRNTAPFDKTSPDQLDASNKSPLKREINLDLSILRLDPKAVANNCTIWRAFLNTSGLAFRKRRESSTKSLARICFPLGNSNP